MIKFRRKEFTLQEGHYTGPKNIDRIPGAIEVIGKSAGIGGAIGGVAGGITEGGSIIGGVEEGLKWGSLSGILIKLFLNYFHKPMSSVKYQDVDKNIRRIFGVYSVAGIPLNENQEKRLKIEDSFDFNNRNVTDYKINFAIHDNQVTLYTFGLTQEELEKVNKVLDRYCKQYFGMEYTAKIINLKTNSYSADITFTNYQSVSKFIVELGKELGTKINLLDNNAIVSRRIQEESEKTFSNINLNKYDILKIANTGLLKTITNPGKYASNAVMSILAEGFKKLGMDECTKLGISGVERKYYNNSYLLDTLKKLHYVPGGFDYKVGEEESDINISLISGVFTITCTQEYEKSIDKGLYNKLKMKIKKSKLGKVAVYTYALKNKNEFNMILQKLISLELVPNVYEF